MTLDLFGGTGKAYKGYDRFDRTIRQRWDGTLSTTLPDRDDFRVTYDSNSNILTRDTKHPEGDIFTH